MQDLILCIARGSCNDQISMQCAPLRPHILRLICSVFLTFEKLNCDAVDSLAASAGCAGENV
jgi:hypothetical protein